MEEKKKRLVKPEDFFGRVTDSVWKEDDEDVEKQDNQKEDEQKETGSH